MTDLLLINPRPDVPAYTTTEVYEASGLAPVGLVTDLTTPTVAGLVPSGINVRICEETITPVDLEARPDFVAITGDVNAERRMAELGDHFRSRGVPVLFGGPQANASSEKMRPHCDILVRGEIEEIATELFADLVAGSWRDEYVGTRPDLRHARPPRWDLYPTQRYQTAAVQTSRGCPFDCEFCDVIVFLGRRQRHKPIGMVLRELDLLYKLGHRYTVLTDDNLTANRSRAKELLAAVADWNRRQYRGSMTFVGHASIEAAEDEELLAIAAQSGLHIVFLGIETPNEESLQETGKLHNLRGDMLASVKRFLDHGIAVQVGIIVGFDADGPDIFSRQYEFCMSLPAPLLTVRTLIALAGTRLGSRLRAAGRIRADASAQDAPWRTNIVPNRMSYEQLLTGIRWLVNKLYAPEAFGHRTLQFVEALGRRRDPAATRDNLAGSDSRPVLAELRRMADRVAGLGPSEARMVETVRRAVADKPETEDFVEACLERYAQYRFLFASGEIWDPRLAELDEPPAPGELDD